MSITLATLGNGPNLGGSRTATEKVAILLAALESNLAVDLLKKLEADDVKQILESSAALGPLTSGDVEPLVEEFAQEFATALGISASPKQLMALLEAAFTSEQIAALMGKAPPPPNHFSWSKFTTGMEASIVPYLLDENHQTGAYMLSMLGPELAAKCLEQMPPTMRTSITSRMLNLREVLMPVQLILQEVVQEDLLGTKVESSDNSKLDKLAAVVNRLDRAQAQEILDELSRENPEDGLKLRKLIFMFEDLERLQQQHRAKLLDRVPAELLIAALFGVEKDFKEGILGSLSARTRRMIESELPAGDSQPKKETPEARRKIAEMAIQAAKNGEIELPDPTSPGEPLSDLADPVPPPEAA